MLPSMQVGTALVALALESDVVACWKVGVYRPQLFAVELLHDSTIAGNGISARKALHKKLSSKYTSQLWINGRHVGSTNPEALKGDYSVDICEAFRWSKFLQPSLVHKDHQLLNQLLIVAQSASGTMAATCFASSIRERNYKEHGAQQHLLVYSWLCRITSTRC